MSTALTSGTASSRTSSQFATYSSFTKAVVTLKEAQGRAALGLIQILDRKKGTILEATETAFRSTAWYGFLKSFDTDRQTTPKERALTHQEQLQRWAASHQEIVRATGIDPFDAATLGKPPEESDTQGNARFDAELDIFTAEHFGLRQSFARTELATTQDPVTLKDDAWERARNYFFETAVEALPDYRSYAQPHFNFINDLPCASGSRHTRGPTSEKMVQLSHNERLQRIIGELLATTDPFA